ncbi:MAG: diguanylate cyclase [Lachnospiraceae bacterium]|nr:diguanylate cyclase [Lachnospiraceae bacterium]
MRWIIHYNICAIVIIVLVLVLFLVRKNYKSKANRVYLYLLLTTLAAAILDLITCFTISWPDLVSVPVNIGINIVYLLVMNSVCFLYFLYATCITRQVGVFPKKLKFFILALYAIDMLLIATTGITGWVFYFDDKKQYCNGPMKSGIYVIALIMLICGLVESIKRRAVLSFVQKMAVYFFTISNIAGVILQLVYPPLLITDFTVSLAMFLIYTTLQNLENYRDPLTGMWNRGAFLETMTQFANAGRQFDLMVIKIEDFSHVNELLGVNSANKILLQISEQMRKQVPDSSLFRISGTKFAVLFLKDDIAKTKRYLELAEEDMKKHLEKPFVIGDMKLKLHPICCLVSCPEHGKTVAELEKVLDFCLLKEKNRESLSIVRADEEALQQVRRKDEIENILSDALGKCNFEVY